MSFEITGIDEMLKNLDKIGKNVRMVKLNAVVSGAKVIQKEMSRRLPRTEKSKSRQRNYPGKVYAFEHLKDHIAVNAVPKGGPDGEFVADIGPEKDFFYGAFLEFGTVNMTAQPFAEPAFLEKRNEALDKIAEVVREAIENG